MRAADLGTTYILNNKTEDCTWRMYVDHKRNNGRNQRYSAENKVPGSKTTSVWQWMVAIAPLLVSSPPPSVLSTYAFCGLLVL